MRVARLRTKFLGRENKQEGNKNSTISTYIMAASKGEEKGESSTTAAKKQLKPNANGITNYELPWYENIPVRPLFIMLTAISGSRNIVQSFWMMS